MKIMRGKGVQLGTHPKRVSANPRSARAWATCDRSGFVTNHDKMVYQWDWRGSKFVNLGILVAEDMADKPQRQLGIFWPPLDPGTLIQARPEPYAMEESSEPNNSYTAEDSATFYVAEDGKTFYVQES